MYHFMNSKPQKQQPLDDLISVRPQLFSFELRQGHEKILHAEKFSKIRYRDQERSEKDKDREPIQMGYTREDALWRPKIPCKKIYDQPKFLLSLERKKIRVINGLRGSDFQVSEVHRSQLKNYKKKSKRETLQRPKIISHPQKVSQTYTHTSLNLQASQPHRISKTPYLNFNLHHLIRERKQANTEHQYESSNHNHNQNQNSNNLNPSPYPYPEHERIRKKGSNLPYHAILKSQRFERSQRSSFQEPIEGLFENGGIRAQVRTAKTSERRRNLHNKSTGHNNRHIEAYDPQPETHINNNNP